MTHNIYIYLIIMAGVTYLIRVLPLTLIRKEITNTFIKSFLYYVPYITLAAMTFPAMMDATNSPVAGAVAFVFAVFLAWKGASLFVVSMMACAMVFIIELAIKFLPFLQ